MRDLVNLIQTRGKNQFGIADHEWPLPGSESIGEMFWHYSIPWRGSEASTSRVGNWWIRLWSVEIATISRTTENNNGRLRCTSSKTKISK